MKAMLHHHAIANVLKKIAPVKPTGIPVDQLAEPHVYINPLKTERKAGKESIYFQTKAEVIHQQQPLDLLLPERTLYRKWTSSLNKP